jgi:hypothetical protein
MRGTFDEGAAACAAGLDEFVGFPVGWHSVATPPLLLRHVFSRGPRNPEEGATECRPYNSWELRTRDAKPSLHETFDFQRHAVSFRLPDKLGVDLENA